MNRTTSFSMYLLSTNRKIKQIAGRNIVLADRKLITFKRLTVCGNSGFARRLLRADTMAFITPFTFLQGCFLFDDRLRFELNFDQLKKFQRILYMTYQGFCSIARDFISDGIGYNDLLRISYIWTHYLSLIYPCQSKEDGYLSLGLSTARSQN